MDAEAVREALSDIERLLRRAVRDLSSECPLTREFGLTDAEQALSQVEGLRAEVAAETRELAPVTGWDPRD